MALLKEKPAIELTCTCGKFVQPGQVFCFNCWLMLPASIAYRLMDSDSGRRAHACIDAQYFLEHQGNPPKKLVPLDRKSAAAGGV